MNILKTDSNSSILKVSYIIILLTITFLLATIVLWSILGIVYFILQTYIFPNQFIIDTLLMLAKPIQLYLFMKIVKDLPTLEELHLE